MMRLPLRKGAFLYRLLQRFQLQMRLLCYQSPPPSADVPGTFCISIITGIAVKAMRRWSIMKTSSNTRAVLWVAQAAMLIALLVVVQLLTFAVPKSVPLVGQLFTGSLVNLVLIVGAGAVGFSGAAVAAVLSPVLAFLFGQLLFPQMIPVVAVGNLVIVGITWAFFAASRRDGKTLLNLAGIAVGAVVKTAVLWAAASLIIVPLFFSASPKLETVGRSISLMFSWPQLVTAVIGGLIALAVIPPVRTALKKAG
jgi:hypothetical protein